MLFIFQWILSRINLSDNIDIATVKKYINNINNLIKYINKLMNIKILKFIDTNYLFGEKSIIIPNVYLIDAKQLIYYKLDDKITKFNDKNQIYNEQTCPTRSNRVKIYRKVPKIFYIDK